MRPVISSAVRRQSNSECALANAALTATSVVTGSSWLASRTSAAMRMMVGAASNWSYNSRARASLRPKFSTDRSNDHVAAISPPSTSSKTIKPAPRHHST
jgi:hypothetical protein